MADSHPLLLATYSVLGGDDNRNSETPDDAATADKQNASPQLPVITPWDPSEATRTYEELCQSPKDREERDLCQQWRMAEVATKQLDWLEAQFWITLAEIGALIFTLAATAWAAIAASRSATAAQQSAALATRVDRPYLVLSGLRLTGLANGGDVGLPDQKNHLVQVESSVKNLGSRIAFIKAVAMETIKAGQNRNPRSARPSAEWKGPHGLAPNEELSGKVPVGLFSMKPPEIRDIQNSRQPFYVFGFIRYGDIHGTVRRTGFAYRFYPSLLARDGYTDDGTFIGVGPDSYWYDIEEPTEKPNE